MDDSRAKGIKGITDKNDGLDVASININLFFILSSVKQEIDIEVYPELIGNDFLHQYINNCYKSEKTVSEYCAIVKVENDMDEKHAILLHLIKGSNGSIKAVITDPLSKKDSSFTNQLTALKNGIERHYPFDIKLIYLGRQDKHYGTCADVCLIMIRELLELQQKKHNQSIVNISLFRRSHLNKNKISAKSNKEDIGHKMN